MRVQVVRGNSIVMMEALEKLWSEVRHNPLATLAPRIAPCSPLRSCTPVPVHAPPSACAIP